jgi:hypothetical protein
MKHILIILSIIIAGCSSVRNAGSSDDIKGDSVKTLNAEIDHMKKAAYREKVKISDSIARMNLDYLSRLIEIGGLELEIRNLKYQVKFLENTISANDWLIITDTVKFDILNKGNYSVMFNMEGGYLYFQVTVSPSLNILMVESVLEGFEVSVMDSTGKVLNEKTYFDMDKFLLKKK